MMLPFLLFLTVGAAHADRPPLFPGKPVDGHPLPMGDFIQWWLVRNWTDEQWRAEYRVLKQVGIRLVIFSPNADSTKKETFYPTKLPGYRLAKGYGDIIETALRNAKKEGMTVFLGLNYEDGFFPKGATDPQYLYRQMEEGNRVAKELYDRYHARYPETFAGWYWVWEVDNYRFPSPKEGKILGKALDITVRGLKKLNPDMPLMLCPYMNSELTTPKQFGDMWRTALANCALGKGDIYCPQDSVGASGKPIETFIPWFEEYRRVVQAKPGLRLWTDSEMFDFHDWSTAPLSRYIDQMQKLQPIVENIVSFTYTHYASPNVVNPGWHKTFMGYVRTGKLENVPPPAPTQLRVVRLPNGSVAVSWTAAFDNMGDCGYEVFRDGQRVGRVHPPAKPRKPGDRVTWYERTPGRSYEVRSFDFTGNLSPKVAADRPAKGQ